MRVLVLGGTRFIGLALVEDLLAAGHEVAVVHRGRHEPAELGAVEHIHVERAALAERRAAIERFAADAAIDLAAMTAADARAAAAALDPELPLVVASSGDVYRACESVFAGVLTDPAPLREDAPLRSGPAPDREAVPPGWDYEPASYEKLDVERICLERGAVVCRLPLVYGPRDYKRREDFVLRRVRAGRERIPVGAGGFLWSRGFAPEIARGLRLAAESGRRGEVFNLAERSCAPILAWIEQILAAAGHEAELVRVPDGALPADLQVSGEIPQPWLLDPGRAAAELGWGHAPPAECVDRSVRWHLDHPPPAADDDRDFSADDAALAAAGF